MRFTKMHGIGNDYIYVDCFTEKISDPSALAIAMSEPHFGVGADGLILILPSEVADFKMRMFNKDGSEGAMCGNGARCVGRFVYEHGLTDRTSFTLETGGGIRQVKLHLVGNEIRSVTVDMGAPLKLHVEEDKVFVCFGSDHVVLFVEEDPFNWDGFDVRGPLLCAEYDANIEFVQVLSENKLRMRVYERGSGETLACGTGSCASLVAAFTRSLTGRSVTVELRGGELQIAWRAEDGHVIMTGPTETVFEGEWKL